MRKIILGLVLLSSAVGAKTATLGDKVKVEYTGKLADGRIFDSSSGRQPIEFTVGSGQMLRKFEDATVGMKVGESKIVEIPATEAYGPFETTKVVGFDKTQMPEGVEVGQYLYLRVNNSDLPVKVIDITEDKMFVDGNHLLAGKDLVFDVKLVDVISSK